MLDDENKPTRDTAVDNTMSLRETLTAGYTDTFEETSCEKVKAVRKFIMPYLRYIFQTFLKLKQKKLDYRWSKKIFFSMLRRATQFPDKQVRDIVL